MNKRLLAIFGVFVLCMLSGPFAVSYGADKEVVFVGLMDYTGPANSCMPLEHAFTDYCKSVNEKGGVDGVKLKHISIDTRYDVARIVSGYKRYRRTKNVLAFECVSMPASKMLIPMVERDGFVIHTTPSGELHRRLSRAFLWAAPYQDCFAAVLDWIMADWKRKGEDRKPTIGVIAWDSDAGREIFLGGKEYLKKLDINILPPQYFAPGTPDHTTYLIRLKKADYIYMASCSDPAPTNIVRDAYRLGIQYPKTTFISDYYGPNWNVGLKAHKKELQGTVVAGYYLRGTDAVNNPIAKKIFPKYRKKPISDMLPQYMAGLALGMIFEEGVRIALKDVGYEKINGTALYAAYQKLGGRDISHGIQGNFCDFSPTSRRATRDVRFYQVKDTVMVPISGWVQTPDAVSMHKWK